MELDEDSTILFSAAASAAASFPLIFPENPPVRGPNKERAHDPSVFLKKFASLDDDLAQRQFGLTTSEFEILFTFLEISSPRDSPDELLLKREQVLVALYWLRQYPTEENIAFQLDLPQTAVNRWLKETVLLICFKLSKWWGDVTPLLSPDIISALPAWSDFPFIKVLCDTTLLPRRRPSELQGLCFFLLFSEALSIFFSLCLLSAYWYAFHRAIYAIKAELLTDICGHILAFACGFRGPQSDTEIHDCMLFLVLPSRSGFDACIFGFSLVSSSSLLFLWFSSPSSKSAECAFALRRNAGRDSSYCHS